MKYNKNNQPLICMQTQSNCYKNTSTMTVKGVLWHSTGANNPNLKRYVQPSDDAKDREEMLKILGKNQYKTDWNHTKVSAGLNCWIGKLADGSVTTVQTMPWNYRPWGCGSGSKGSCNSGWIQFEICEDALTDKVYFDQVYKEACEITAYLCKMYNIDPFGTVVVNGVKIPTILCHADSYELGMGSNHSDVMHWFRKYGKTMENVREDVAKLMEIKIVESESQTPTNEIYRVRKDWKKPETQIGAYQLLENAQIACDKAGADYFVFDSKGQKVYPVKTEQTVQTRPVLSINDTGKAVIELQTKLKELGFDCKGIDGDFGLNTYNSLVAFQRERNLTPDGVCGPLTWKEIYAFAPYQIIVTAAILNVRYGPSSSKYKVKSKLIKNSKHTIVYQKKEWGKLKNGQGWICLKYVKKI